MLNSIIKSLSDLHSVREDTEMEYSAFKRVNIPKIRGQTFVFRPDSPRTQLAMKELGFVMSDLKQKTKEDLKNEGVSADLLEWRYVQYNSKVAKNLKELFDTRKKIIKDSQKINTEIQPYTTRLASPGIDIKYVNTSRLNGSRLDALISPKDLKSPKFFASGAFNLLNDTSQSLSLYQNNKTINCLRNTQSISDIRSVDYLKNPLEVEIVKQIENLNEFKMRNQKELMGICKNELKRIEVINQIKERELENEKKEKKNKQELAKKINERKLRYQEKILKLKEIEEENIRKQLNLERELKRKLEHNEKKYEEEQEVKKRLLIEHEEKQQKRKEELARRKALKEQLLDAELEKTKIKIDQKLIGSKIKYEQNMTERLNGIRSDLAKAAENTKKMKEKIEEDNAQQLSNILYKIEKRDEHLKKWQKELYKNYIEKKKEAEEKEKKIYENFKEEIENQKAKTKDFEERFQKSLDQVAQIKEQEEKNIKRKQEMRKIKMMEQIKNRERNLRKQEYEQQKIIYKEKLDEEKLIAQRYQKDLLSKARNEIAIQKQLEKDRFSQSIIGISKLIASSTSDPLLSPSDNDPLYLSLNKVLREDDIKTLREQTRRTLHSEQKNQKEGNGEGQKSNQINAM